MFRKFDTASGLHVGVWEPDAPTPTTPTILAVHGITSSHKAWAPLARQLPDVRIIAPDLRGRGGSRALPGPYGMSRHAADLSALLAEFGVGRCLAVGHSMGGYVVVTLAHEHAGLVSGLVLVDGGLCPAAWVAEQVERQPRVRVVEVPDVNHYTITLSDPGATAVAGAVRDALAGARV
ncbi:alpha/beta fold hydrolase [Propioniciclava sinopodophylli]|uniref:Alpha/beta fold hydrolase n=1 Tax=Propioniciclava sinopodophylli TaxID=1837344 RepID=A0A4Q9KIV0_9ACTN|nr:alpha/beta fold hydrolase [Propioniciclava sinopodophylli]TBT88526.1 alpha/beta fold hydrolase [Propioniciclava sinopodophylli]